MKSFILIILASMNAFVFLHAEETHKEQNTVVEFTPPQNWRFAQPDTKLKNVKLIVVGNGESTFPPSISLAAIPFKGNLKSYLKSVKAINDAQGDAWKDLGAIQTQIGTASLSQLDTKQVWGDVRMMHVIIIKNEHAYVLTAAALKEEFPKYYKDFFNSMRSLRIKS